MTASEDRRRRPGDVATVGVVVLALAVRVAVGVWRGEDLLSEGNGFFYIHGLARSLAQHGTYEYAGNTNVFQQPGYVFALAAGYRLLGVGWPALLAVNALIGTALVAVTMRLASRLDARAVLPAGLLAAVHPVLVWHGLGVADTTLFSLALVGWLDSVLAGLRDPRPRHAVVGGLWVGLAFLTRPSLLPLLPIGLVAPVIVQRAWRPALRTALTWLVVGLAITAPWMIRNQALTGKALLIGTHGPESVWAANTDESPRATELDSTYDAVSALHNGTEFDVRAFQVHVPPREAVRRERMFRDATVEWVRAHPGDFARMSAVRLVRMWDPRYHPTRRWERPLGEAGRRATVHLVVHAALLLLALAGIVALWRRGERRAELLVVLAVLAVYSLSHCVGAGYSRVRFPVDPVVVAMAAAGLRKQALG